VYYETQKILSRAIQKKKRGMLTSSVLLDDAHLHTSARIRALLEHLIWELFDHPPYSSYHALSYNYLFARIYLKNCLRSQHLNNNELLGGVKTWLSLQSADYFDASTHKLTTCFDKFLNFGDDYFET
jgi:hypothetical protein